MRKLKLLGLFAVLVSTQAIGQVRASRTATVTLALTAAAPLVNPNLTQISSGRSSGVPGALHLTGCSGFRVTMCAANNATLSGTGTIQYYYWPDYLPASVTPASWPRNPGIDETVSVTATSCNTLGAASPCSCQTFPDHIITGWNGGWVYAAPSSVTASAGTSVSILIEAVCAQ